MESILLSKTMELIAHDRHNWPATAKATDISRSWIASLHAGGIREPGVLRTERLFFYLANKYPYEPASKLAVLLKMGAVANREAPDLPFMDN